MIKGYGKEEGKTAHFVNSEQAKQCVIILSLSKSCPMNLVDQLFFLSIFFLFSCFKEKSIVIPFVKFKPNLIVGFSTSVLACPTPLH